MGLRQGSILKDFGGLAGGSLSWRSWFTPLADAGHGVLPREFLEFGGDLKPDQREQSMETAKCVNHRIP
jgi:hypothetical protein